LTAVHAPRQATRLARHDEAIAARHWQQAATLIEQTGYHRRDGKLAEIKEQ